MKRRTIQSIYKMKAKGERIVMTTAYDATFAKLLDSAGFDILLVGDTLGMVIQGHDSTLPVKIEHTLYHTQAVVRGSKRALVVGDMPFMSYQVSVSRALENAGRLLAEGGCQAIKLEGAGRNLETISAMVEAGIPVMGHLGLTPQSVHVFGGYRVQGRDEGASARLIEQALAVQEAGAFAVVLEGMPRAVGKAVTAALEIPTIGIGAGPDCDGQVLVCYDFLGMEDDFQARFVRRFADLSRAIREASGDFIREVRQGTYPSDEESYE